MISEWYKQQYSIKENNPYKPPREVIRLVQIVLYLKRSKRIQITTISSNYCFFLIVWLKNRFIKLFDVLTETVIKLFTKQSWRSYEETNETFELLYRLQRSYLRWCSIELSAVWEQDTVRTM